MDKEPLIGRHGIQVRDKKGNYLSIGDYVKTRTNFVGIIESWDGFRVTVHYLDSEIDRVSWIPSAITRITDSEFFLHVIES